MKTKKPKVIVMSGYGLNCEDEVKFAFESAGASAEITHLNDLIAAPAMLLDCDILVFPGGFAYGDDTGSGKAYANKFKNHLTQELKEFLSRDTLVIGICNGFQIITNLGILPGGLKTNSKGKYIDRWVDLKVVGRSPWLAGIKEMSVPIAHGEGRYVIDKKQKTRTGLVYTKGKICKYQNLTANPNGSEEDIAGVLGYNGRVLGLMPHPERAMFYFQNPLWQLKKQVLGRNVANEAGEGFRIFQNGVNYFIN